jgi:cytoskeletal protein CcmA (bactofilin family)
MPGSVGGLRVMKTDGNIYRQDLTIRENTIFQGLVMGSITVAPNVILEMRGSAAMDVILNEGSKLELYGQVGGDVVNRGGMVVHNEGSIKGKIVE